MTSQWSLPGWVVVAALAVLLLVLVGLVCALVVVRSGTRRALDASQRDALALREQVAAIERRLATRRPASGADEEGAREYVITRLGDETAPAPRPDEVAHDAPSPTVDPSLFADLVLREGVVQATSFAAGLRRALSPETRHRIRLEMRREVKRARKQRRADLREARRQWEARRRAEGSAA